MNEEETVLFGIQAVIISLPIQDGQSCLKCAARLRQIISDAGDMGRLALALVGAELAAQEETHP